MNYKVAAAVLVISITLLVTTLPTVEATAFYPPMDRRSRIYRFQKRSGYPPAVINNGKRLSFLQTAVSNMQTRPHWL